MNNGMTDNRKVMNWITHALDALGGVLIIDNDARIVYISVRYAEYLLGVAAEEAMGKPLQHFLPQSELLTVLRTGIPQQGQVLAVEGHSLVVSMIPVVENGRLMGAMAVTIFSRVDDAREFARRILGTDEQLDYYKEEVKRLWGAKYSFDSIRGNSLAIIEAKRRAWDIATTHSPVLLIGDTGTGKELFAHAIHLDSPYRDGPFISVNCAGIPDNLVESELFGYDDGAFTGAKRGGKPGKFELAQNGTIFLDEVGELPLHVQAVLLRVLQEKEIERVGGTSLIPLKLRVISASNADLEIRVRQGTFREDLYYRLNVFSVRIPPLRSRMEDIPALGHYFISRFNQEVGTAVTGLSSNALEVLMSYHWPGNVRELKSTIERACLEAKMGLIRPENLYYITDRLGHQGDDLKGQSLKQITDQAQKAAIIKALEMTGGNRKLACEILKVNRTTFYAKLKEFGLQ